MPSFTTTTLLTTLSALALTASVSAAPINVPTPVGAVARAQPTGWATGYLEDYASYHVRYLALECQSQHNTTFFSTCCHPLLAAESLTTRPDECAPTDDEIEVVTASIAEANASVSATATATGSAAEAEETDEADAEADDIYCDDSTSVAAVVSSVAAPIASTATESVSVVTLVSSYTAAATGTESASAAAVTETIAVVAQNFVQSASSSEWSSSSKKAKWTSSSSPAWTHASTSTSTSTSSTAAAATSTASSSGGSGTTYTGGKATYFYQNGNAGECGTVHSDSDYIIAIDSNGWWSDYQTNAASPYCGKSIVITNTNNGKSVTAVVADVCPTCVSDNSLDLSVGAFTAIASESDGMVPITWQWA